MMRNETKWTTTLVKKQLASYCQGECQKIGTERQVAISKYRYTTTEEAQNDLTVLVTPREINLVIEHDMDLI